MHNATSGVPRHKETPLGIGTPLRRYVGNGAAFGKGNHLRGVAIGQLVKALGGGLGSYGCAVLSVHVGADDVNILVARVPIGVVLFGSPHPDEVVYAALLEEIEPDVPQLALVFGRSVAPPEPFSRRFV